MIGYDIPSASVINASQNENPSESKPPKSRVTGDSSFHLVTHGRQAIKFEYSIEKDGVKIQKRDGRLVGSISFLQIEDILKRIEKDFGWKEFPLANDFEHAKNGTLPQGLGLYTGECGSKARLASYLGPILSDLGIFDWNNKKIKMGWHLKYKAPGAKAIEELIHANLAS